MGVGVGPWELQGGWEEAFPTPTQMVKVGVGVGVVPRWESVKWESVNVFTPRGRPIYTSHFPPSRIVRAIENFWQKSPFSKFLAVLFC